MTAPPARSTLSGTPTNAQFNAGIGALYDYTVGLLGASGTPAAARAALGLAAPDASSLIGYTPAGAGAVATTVQSKLREFVSVRDFGAAGNGTDATTAFANAFATGKPVYVPSGTYLLNYLSVPAGTFAFGDGPTTIIKPLTPDIRAALTADSGSASAFVSNVSFRSMRFESVSTLPFAEHSHLVTLNGTSNWQFEDCEFVGWRGDAIYLGSSDLGGPIERHNKNVYVTRCHFDGVNNNNRQALSAIDVDGLWINECTFVNCTASTMPGVIDLEPDSNPFHIIRNVWVTNNKFHNCGGNVGTVAIFLPVNTMPVPTNIFVENNVSTGSVQVSGAGFFTVSLPYTVTSTSVDSHIRVRNNKANGGGGQGRGIYIHRGTRGVISEGNVWEDFAPAGVLVAFAATCRDIVIRDTIRRCGSQASTPVGAEIGAVDYLDMSGCVFDDCGDGSASASAIHFISGTSTNVKLNNITITSPTGKTTRAVVRDAGHTFTPATNQHFGCSWGALLNLFEAHESDSIFTAYTPLVEGTTTEGVGTYTRQYGRWRRIGKQVFFEVEIIQTGHTGTGMIEISLPVPVAGSSNNELRAVALSLSGVSTTGGQIGLINPAAVAGGVTGSVRCYHSGTGTLAQTLVPAGAAEYRVAGTYMAA